MVLLLFNQYYIAEKGLYSCSLHKKHIVSTCYFLTFMYECFVRKPENMNILQQSFPGVNDVVCLVGKHWILWIKAL